jgi:hypothetical protein
LIRFQVSAQAPDYGVFLAFVDFFLHFFQSEMDDVVMVEFLARQHFAESQP